MKQRRYMCVCMLYVLHHMFMFLFVYMCIVKSKWVC